MKAVAVLLCAAAAGLAGGLLAPMLTEDQGAGPARETRRTSDPNVDLVPELLRRIEVLERERMKDTAPVREGTVAPTRVDSEGAVDTASKRSGKKKDDDKPIPKAVRERVAGLLGKEFTHDDSNELFWGLLKEKSQIADTIRALQKELEKDPDNPELHVALATAYGAQLSVMPQGAEQGFVWAKASAAYDTAIKLKPDHWQARFGKAFGVSMAPEFLGMRPEAIKQFEELRRIQEQRAPAPHHVQTYFRLGTLYKNMGNAEKAREIWDHGLKLFPQNEVLKGALEASTTK